MLDESNNPLGQPEIAGTQRHTAQKPSMRHKPLNNPFFPFTHNNNPLIRPQPPTPNQTTIIHLLSPPVTYPNFQTLRLHTSNTPIKDSF